MSTVLSDSSAPTLPRSTSRLNAPEWMREPLLHFVLLGTVLFGVDALLVSRTDDPSLIVVDAEVDREAIELFETSRGRRPNEQELQALRQVWLDNEVLYREGLALGLDRGDKAIRERVIFKALNVVDSGTKRPAYDEAALKEWFEKNRAKYDEPARYDFQEAVLAGASSEAAVRAFVSALNSGAAPDIEAGLRVFNDRPHGNIVQSYGEEFAKALEQSPRGEWLALQSGKVWRAMRLESMTPSEPADFERLRGVVLQDWTDAVMAQQRSAAVRALANKYTIKIEGAAQ